MSYALAPSVTAIAPSPSITLARSLSHSVDEVEAMGPLELFESQLNSGSTEAKVDAVQRLPIVAYALGKEAVVQKLLPILMELSNGGGGNGAATSGASTQAQQAALASNSPPEDELLLLIAKEVETFVPGLLSETEEVMALLPLLERLASVEETVVRDRAVMTLNHIIRQLGGMTLHVADNVRGANASASTNASSTINVRTRDNDTVTLVETSVSQRLIAMAKRLVGAEWFTAKVSAAGILPDLYSVTQDPDICSIYRDLCCDDTPMVRRSASKHLGDLLQRLGVGGESPPKDLATDLMPVLSHLCRLDEQDSVRMLAVATLADIGPNFAKSPEWTKEYLLPILKEGTTDLSWRVRHNLSKHFSDVAQNLGFSGNQRFVPEQTLVIACFVSLLSDVEAEVRAASVGHLAKMVHWGGAQLFQSHLMPLLPNLADDVVMEVRSKCALALMDSSQGGTLDDNTIVQTFSPLLEAFLQDEFQEVQLQVLGNLHKLSHLLHGMNGVVSSILNMSKATNWRVREGVAKILPHLCEARGVEFFLSVLLEPAWLVLLLDPVASVRSACVTGMGVLVPTAGPEWVSENILPQHVRIYNQAASGSYLIRITILRAHAATAVACAKNQTSSSPEMFSLWNDAVLQVLRGLVDKVANVRMVSAMGLSEIIRGVDGDEQQMAVLEAQIRPALEKRLQEDDDPDCQDACQAALKVTPNEEATSAENGGAEE